ncbi:Methyl-accepting chemotaxis protein PctB [Vibrio aerogenes CECT 7868]|uniref:Methyl-accepting chemotaxis protein PctB n=1 Tax=Vibrio aerogenes CECT 7868 TaxID=1216006 RepID=A0A1M6DEG5_9VIBR|nr:methyl-accepting chemotaxis protein [Vibrio aerogenes]SHI71646.1 Methyl-accepting chemotaxis protein PctB [Vibrio aerogenes CECT 7868]
MNIGSKFILSIVSIATLAVASTAIVLATLSSDKTEEILLDARRDQMISLRNVATEILHQYFGSLENQILSISQQQSVIDATRNLSSSYKPFAFFVGRTDRPGQREKLRQYYQDNIAAQYSRFNPGQRFDTNAVIDAMSDPTIALQTQYIAANPNTLDSKDNMLFSSDKTSYTTNHKKYHPYFQDSLKRFHLQDILLLDTNGNVVYSVKKYIDFAASVSSAAFAGSGLAEAYNRASQLESSGYAFVDYAPYPGASGLPTGFISAPVFEKNKRVGVVVLALSSVKLTELMTYGYNWEASGLGQTGETYLIGADQTPRSASRLLLEQPEAYAAQVKALNYPQQEIDKILATKTNVAFQQIKSHAIDEAFNGNAGTTIDSNYLNHQVLTAFAPLNIMGQKWVLLNEIEMAEVTSKLGAIQKSFLVYAAMTAIVVIILGGVAGAVITQTIVRPIRETSHSLIDIAEGEGDLTSRLNAARKDELGELATGFNQFVAKIHQLVLGIKGSMEGLSRTVDNMNTVAEEGSESANTQQKETEMVVAAINQMAASAQEIAGNAMNAADVANSADTEGKHVQSVVDNAISSIEGLSEEIDQASVVITELEGNVGNIVAILDTIRGIADQTNLLALNAAIESARAGEHGRGFAVVADEVRALAKKTQDSTEEIQEMIERLQKDSIHAVNVMASSKANGEKSADIARTVGTSLIKIADFISTISDMNAQIAGASDEQKTAIEEINRSMVEISNSGQQTLSGVNSITQNSADLRALSHSLEEQIQQFRV